MPLRGDTDKGMDFMDCNGQYIIRRLFSLAYCSK